MSSVLGSVRRLLFAPSLTDVTFVGRGFVRPDPAVAARLEAVPRSVVVGFEVGIEAGNLQEISWRLELVEEELRGFAYEGATMALTVLDRLVPGRRSRTRELLCGPAAPYAFLTYIGIGFAMARLPRARWRGVLPDLTGSPYYPSLSWLAVDGYGFDLAFFHPRRWVDEQRVPRPYPWLGAAAYFPHAVDQGIGRALWFIHGARVDDVSMAVRRFAPPRRGDLWSGVGLAAAFAGGADDGALRWLRASAGEHGGALAQGAAFAAKARTYAGLVPVHTDQAVRALAGTSARQAAATVDAAVESSAGTAESPLLYEEWRKYVRQHFARVDNRI
jgi:enediyne biosynthesis protein E2